MADNSAENNKPIQMTMIDQQGSQECVILSDDVKASLIRQEQINSSSSLSDKINISEKPESINNAEIKPKDSEQNSPQDETLSLKIKSSIDPTKTDALYFIGLNSLALNILSASNIFTSTSAKTVAILWLNLLTYLALYQRQPILTFLTKMIKKTREGHEKTKEIAYKNKERLLIIVGIITVVAIVLTFQHMNGQITRLEKQNSKQFSIIRILEIELNRKSQRTNQVLHELKAQLFLNQQDSTSKINYLTKQVKQLESIILNQQQHISNMSSVKREEKQFSQEKQTTKRSGIKEDIAGNKFISKSKTSPQQQTQQNNSQQQPKSQEQTQQQKSHQKPQYQRQNAMRDDRLDFITNSFMKLNNIIHQL